MNDFCTVIYLKEKALSANTFNPLSHLTISLSLNFLFQLYGYGVFFCKFSSLKYKYSVFNLTFMWTYMLKGQYFGLIFLLKIMFFICYILITVPLPQRLPPSPPLPYPPTPHLLSLTRKQATKQQPNRQKKRAKEKAQKNTDRCKDTHFCLHRNFIK